MMIDWRGVLASCVLLAVSVMLLVRGNAISPVPAEVRPFVETEVPADGNIHVMRSSGEFKITPETFVCRVPRTIARSLKEYAPRFLGPGLGEQTARLSSGDGGELGELVSGRPCVNDGINILNYWMLVPHRDGEPYKLVLAVWQGDPANGGAVWVGGVERADGYRPELQPDDFVLEDPPIGMFGQRLSAGSMWDELEVLARRRSLAADAQELTARSNMAVPVIR